MTTQVISVNGVEHEVQSRPDCPLLYVLRNELLCRGRSSVAAWATAARARCSSTAARFARAARRWARSTGEVTTLEGLPRLWGAGDGELHPVQQAWIDEQVPQCGYCQNGMIIAAVDLLSRVPDPSVAEIKRCVQRAGPASLPLRHVRGDHPRRAARGRRRCGDGRRRRRPRSTRRRLESWIQIRPDNTIAIRTGVGDFGQGTVGTGFRQIVAEELRVPFEAVSELVAGDTDRTPDGGIAAGSMNKIAHEHCAGRVGIHPDSPFGRSALNLQKAAAYAYGALLERASLVLGAPVEALTADGRRRLVRRRAASPTPSWCATSRSTSGSRSPGAGRRLRHLRPRHAAARAGLGVPRDRHLVSEPAGPADRRRRRPTGSATCGCPGCCTGGSSIPATLGSTLVSVGSLDRRRVPGRRGRSCGGTSSGSCRPTSGRPIRAARGAGGDDGLERLARAAGNDGLVEAMLETDWSTVPVGDGLDRRGRPSKRRSRRAADARTPSSRCRSTSTRRSAPRSRSPTCAATARSHVWTCSQQPQALRTKLATMLETDPENVVVHFADGAGGFGRTTRGDAGPEAEAVILSQACGRPVRLQWTREEDFAWSTQQAPLPRRGLGRARRRRVGWSRSRPSTTSPGINDGRCSGRSLAGLPTEPAGADGLVPATRLDRVALRPRPEPPRARARRAERRRRPSRRSTSGCATGACAAPSTCSRTSRSSAMVSEAAAAAGADPIQYRIDHTTDDRA